MPKAIKDTFIKSNGSNNIGGREKEKVEEIDIELNLLNTKARQVMLEMAMLLSTLQINGAIPPEATNRVNEVLHDWAVLVYVPEAVK